MNTMSIVMVGVNAANSGITTISQQTTLLQPTLLKLLGVSLIAGAYCALGIMLAIKLPNWFEKIDTLFFRRKFCY